MNDITDFIFDNPQVTEQTECIVDDRGRVTFQQLRERVSRLAGGLRRLGVERGSRVALLSENRREFLESFFAITAIGALSVPLNTRLHEGELTFLLRDSGATVLLAAPTYADTAWRLRDEVEDLREIIDFGSSASGARYEQLLADSDHLDIGACRQEPDHPAVILYTSGTTSQPKGAVLTHRNYVVDVQNLIDDLSIRRADRNLQFSPLYHAANAISFAHLAVGGCTFLPGRIDIEQALKTIARERITHFFAVPTVLYRMVDHPVVNSVDLSSLRSITYGAAPITGARLSEVLRVLGPKVFHAYGLTECTSHASLLAPEDLDIASGSIGKGIGSVRVVVVDEALERVPAGELGEVVVSGEVVMQGYWNRPDATAEVLRGGYLCTGDIGRTDENGFVYIVDRKKDMLISGGLNIYPREIEEVLAQHPAIGDVAVYGAPHDEWGEVPIAAVVLREDSDPVTPAELVEFARAAMASYKVPKRIDILAELPKTASGKVVKRLLRASEGTYREASNSTSLLD